MTTQIDVLNAEITDLQNKLAGVDTAAAVTKARFGKQITDKQAQITALETPPAE